MIGKTIRNMSGKQKFALVAILVPPMLALFVYLGGLVVMSLWNWLVPPLFGLPEVTFWQGLGLVLLGRILFGGFGGGGGSGSSHSRGPKDRERLREAMRKHREDDAGASPEPSC
jgi:hypothetical protein